MLLQGLSPLMDIDTASLNLQTIVRLVQTGAQTSKCSHGMETNFIDLQCVTLSAD